MYTYGGGVGDTGDVQTALCLLSLFHFPTVPTVPSIAEHLSDSALEWSVQNGKILFKKKKILYATGQNPVVCDMRAALLPIVSFSMYAFLIQPVLNNGK